MIRGLSATSVKYLGQASTITSNLSRDLEKAREQVMGTSGRRLPGREENKGKGFEVGVCLMSEVRMAGAM